MKKLTLGCLFICITLFNPLLANDEKYKEAMKKNIATIYEANEMDTFQEAINSLERIAATEKTKWEPFYYIGYGNIMMATRSQDGGLKDKYLDRALDAISKAKAIAQNESEVLALEGFALLIRISVDPSSRGAMYAPEATRIFTKAVSLNEHNPRALALKAQMEFGTAQFFGSPATEACATNSRALEKFITDKSDNELAPTWGIVMAKQLQSRCQ